MLVCRGTEVGVTVDPVKIDNVAQFGTPKEVGKRVMGVEVTSLVVTHFG